MVRRSLSAAQAKGLSCHLHANGVSGGDENGPGGHAVLPTEEGLEGPQCIAASQQRCADNRWVQKTICWSSSGAASEAIYTLLNQTFEGLPPLLLCHMVTASSFQTQISLSYSPLLSWWCSAPGFSIQSNHLETVLFRFFFLKHCWWMCCRTWVAIFIWILCTRVVIHMLYCCVYHSRLENLRNLYFSPTLSLCGVFFSLLFSYSMQLRG